MQPTVIGIGVGLSVLTLCLRWLFPAVPHPVAWAGLSIGGGIVVASFFVAKVKPEAVLLGLLGLGLIVGAVTWQLSLWQSAKAAPAHIAAPATLERTTGDETVPTTQTTVIRRAETAPQAAVGTTVVRAHPENPPAQEDETTPGPFKWEFNEIGSVFGWNDAADGSLLVGVYRIIGHNTSQRPVEVHEAYVKLFNNGKKLPLKFVTRDGLLDPEEATPVAPGAQFSLAYKIPPTDPRHLQGVSVEEYLKQYGAFSFHLTYGDNKQVDHDFLYEDLKSKLLAFQAARIEQHRPTPEVGRKGG